MSNFKKLKIWEDSKNLAKYVYEFTSNFPKEELYGITSQMRRSAVSVPSNIAEGYARHGDKDFLRFLGIAGGSLAELETQFILSFELGFVEKTKFELISKEINNLKYSLWSFRKSLRSKILQS